MDVAAADLGAELASEDPRASDHQDGPGPAERWFPIAVLAIMAVAALAFLAGIGAKSIWRDEGFSISTSLRSWSSLIDLSLHTETNAVLYAFALKAWSVFGDSEAVLRGLSAACMLGSVAAIALLGRRLFGTRAALLAAGVLAVHGSIISYAQTIRTYALSVLLASLVGLFFAMDVERPRRWTIAAWTACGVLMVLAHTVAVTLVVANVVSLLFLPATQRLLKRRLIGAGVVCAAAIALLAVVQNNEEGQALLSLRPGVFKDTIYVLTGRGGFPGVLAVLAAVLLGVWASWRVTRAKGWVSTETWRHAFVLGWAVIPPVIVVVVSVVQPVLIGRFLLFTVPGIALTMGMGLDWLLSGKAPGFLRERWAALVTTALVFAGLVAGALWWHRDGDVEDWRQAARVVFEQAQPTDGLLFANDSIRLFYDYYQDRIPHDADPAPVWPSQPWGEYGTGDQAYTSFTTDMVLTAAGQHDRLWLVIGEDHVDVGDEVDAAIEALRQRYEIVSDEHVGEGIRIILVDTASPVS
jgi:mannosyltransferase